MLDDLLPAQLFRHLPAYRVAICSVCRYAVSPKAVDRHLKEIHRIQASSRKPFVDFVHGLDLCDPEDVVPPPPDRFPIPELPTFTGLRCGSRNCGHICLTEKRMRSHWTSVGHEGGAHWLPIPVQTFFRGNQLKYFSGSFDHTDSNRMEGLREGDAGSRELVELSCEERRPTSPHQLTSSDEGSIPSSFTIDEPPNGLEPHAAALLRHYRNSTSTTITTDSNDEFIWGYIAVQLAYEHEFLMMALLSLTSLHLAHLYPDRRTEYTMEASKYQDKAMPLFRDAVAKPTIANCNAILVFSHMLVLYTFAAERQDDDLLLVGKGDDDIVPPWWLHFMRSGCSMLCEVWDYVEAGPIRTLAIAWDAPLRISKSYEKATLDSLLALMPPPSSDRSWPEDICYHYREAAKDLAVTFAFSESTPDRFTTWDALRVWPMRISEEFMTLLKRHHPSALILLAHYSLLLQRIESKWYFQGRARRLVRTILHFLDPYWHPCITSVVAAVEDSKDDLV